MIQVRRGNRYYLALSLGAVALTVLTCPSSLAEPSRANTTIIHLGENRSSSPQNLTVVDDRLFFTADDGLHGQELWCLEPGEPPHLLADLWPGPVGSMPRNLLSMAGRLYFVAQHDFDGQPLDVVLSLERGIDSIRCHMDAEAYPSPAGTITLASSGDQLYGAAHIQGAGREFVRFVPDATFQYWDTFPGLTGGLPQKHEWFGLVNSRLVFAVQGQSNSVRFLWAADSEGRVHPLLGESSRRDQQTFSFPMSLDVAGGSLYIAANHADEGIELWVSDGTVAGTRFVKDICPGPNSGLPSGATALQGTAYFRADDGVHGVELWRSDGTDAGTWLVKDLQPGSGGSGPYSFCAVGESLYFCAETITNGNELWRTDGTPEGTVLVEDVFPGPDSSNPYQLTAFGDELLFAADHPVYGEEMWRSDGTPEGTRLVKDICPGPGLSEPYSLTPFSGSVYFCANDGRHGEELWCTDGTAEGTRLVADIYPETRILRSANATQLTAADNGLYIVADDLEHGAELWWSDAATKDTHLVQDINSGAAHSDPRWLTYGGGELFFVADDGQHGTELWRAGRGPDLTKLVTDLCPGGEGSSPEHLLAVQTHLFFAAKPDRENTVLYKIAFGDAEPVALTDVDMLVPSSQLDGLSLVDGTVYAVLRDTVKHYHFAVWNEADESFEMLPVSFPQAPQWPDVHQWASTHQVTELTESLRLLHCYLALPSMADRYCKVALGMFWFSAYTPEHGVELWQSELGAAKAVLSQDCIPGPGSSAPEQFVMSGGNLYFAAESPEQGRTLWYVPNGLGEARVVDRNSASHGEGLGPGNLTAYRNGIRLVCSHPERPRGDQVLAWCGEDGRAPALHRHPLPYAEFVLNPLELTVVGDYLYFTAENNAVGRELWRTAGETRLELVANLLSEEEYRHDFVVFPSVFHPTR